MPHSPQQQSGSKRYADSWRAVNELIRSDASWSGRERNVCYRNDSDGAFTDVSFLSGLDFPADGRAFAAADIDHDGDLDLILKSRTAPQVRIMRNNRRAGAGRAIEVDLRGVKSNRDAVGAQAILATGKRRLLRTVRAEFGYLAQPSRRLHFALEAGERPESLEIRWPGGGVQTFTEIPDGFSFRITEGSGRWEPLNPPRPPTIEPKPERLLTTTPGTWLLEPVTAPAFSIGSSGGTMYSLAAQRGKKVLLNFWATWCPPCREELAGFVAHAEAFARSGLELAAVSVDDPADREQVIQFATKYGAKFPVLFADDDIVAAYSILNRYLFDRRRDLSLPSSFLIDEQGRIIKVYLGVTPVAAILADAAARDRPAIPLAGRWHSGPPGRDFVEMATAMTERGLTRPAEAMFETAIAGGQSNTTLYNNFAAVLIERGRFERAEELLRVVLRVDPNQVDALVNLGNLYLKQGKHPEAIEALTKAVAVQPDDAAAYSALGSSYFAAGNLPAAERNFRRAAGIDGSDLTYAHNLGSVLAASGVFSEALPLLEKARELGGESVKLRNDLGVVYMQTGQPDLALNEFRSAIETDPGNYDTRLNLSQHFFAAGDRAKAREWMNKARDLQPDNPSSYMIEARFLAAEQQFAEAKAVLESYLSTHPGVAPAQEMLRGLP